MEWKTKIILIIHTSLLYTSSRDHAVDTFEPFDSPEAVIIARGWNGESWSRAGVGRDESEAV